MVNLEPHHDSEVDVLVTDARGNDWDLETLVKRQLEVGHLHFVCHTIELSPTFVVSSDAVVILKQLAFIWSEPVCQIELLDERLQIVRDIVS